MTTITKERLQEVIDGDIAFTDEQREMARIALTSLDAEHVAYMYKDGDDIEYNGHNEFSGGGKGVPLYTAPQPALVVPYEMYWQDAPVEGSTRAAAYATGWNACRAAMLQAGNSPVTPDGYVLVPNRLTAENGAKCVLSGEFSETKFINCPECFGDDECETCDGSGRIEITVPVTWTTIKAIWAKGVEHFAAAPQQEVIIANRPG